MLELLAPPKFHLKGETQAVDCNLSNIIFHVETTVVTVLLVKFCQMPFSHVETKVVTVLSVRVASYASLNPAISTDRYRGI